MTLSMGKDALHPGHPAQTFLSGIVVVGEPALSPCSRVPMAIIHLQRGMEPKDVKALLHDQFPPHTGQVDKCWDASIRESELPSWLYLSNASLSIEVERCGGYSLALYKASTNLQVICLAFLYHGWGGLDTSVRM